MICVTCCSSGEIEQTCGDCDDGLFCNGAERCVDGSCMAGSAPELSDGVDCTDDSCDEGADQILHTPNHASCDDGLFCNGEESCGPDGCESPGNPCNAQQTCNEEADRCEQLPDDCTGDGDCDDGLFCNGAERCVDGSCVAGTAPSLDDGVDCTEDSCDEESDQVLHGPNDAACDDGLFCTGSETCSPTEGCLSSGDPCTSAQSCNELTDQCDPLGDLLPLDDCDFTSDIGAIATTSLPEPGYLSPYIDPDLGCQVMRITGDPGTPIGSTGENWSDMARHGYSKRQPWNADQSLIYLSDASSSSGVFLDGETYEPLFLTNRPVSMTESRWHPSRPDIRIYVHGNTIGEWDVPAGTASPVATIAGYSEFYLGPWEGNLSLDGTRLAVFAVDPDGAQVAFGYDLDSGTKGPDILLEDVPVDWVSISPLGGHIVVNGWNDNTQVYTWDGQMVGARWTEYGRPSHYDLAVDGNGDEVAVGVSKSDPDDGHVIKRRLSDGAVTVLTPGGYASHTSARNLLRPGWAYVTYNHLGPSWPPYHDEIIAVPLDGSQDVQRLAKLHNEVLDYKGESQGVPSPDGRRVIFASNWDSGSSRPIRGYVIDTAPLCTP